MLRNYLTVGIRSLLKNRAYAAINILGLAIGMAACLMILLYVRYETSWDGWIPNADRAVQLQTTYVDRDGGDPVYGQSAPYVARVAMKDFPEFDAISYVTNSQPVILRDGIAETHTITLVDRDFLKIFPLTILHGSGPATMADTTSVMVSRRNALALFGSEDVVGRTLTAIIRGKQTAYRVGAVFADIPKNTHEDFGIIRRVGPDEYTGTFRTQWGEYDGWVYAHMRPGADVNAINAKMPAWQARNVPYDDIGGRKVRQDDGVSFYFRPFPEIHLARNQWGSDRPGNDRTTIVTFAIVALMILGMACVNFVNLATARGSQRAREVALRKVLGATRRDLILQFLVESVLVAAVAMLIALALTELALPYLGSFLRADLHMAYLGRDGTLLPILLLVVLVGVAGGAYPAFALSAFRPARVLKANRSSDAGGSGRLRNLLVIGQFAIAIGLIICTAVVYAQTVYARIVDPGFQRKGLLQVENLAYRAMMPLRKTVLEQVKHVPGVTNAALTAIGEDTMSTSNNAVLLPGRDQPVTIGGYSVGWDFFETMGIRLIAGRYLSQANALDDVTPLDPVLAEADPAKEHAAELAMAERGGNVVINDAARVRMGFKSPQDALGKVIRISLGDPGVPVAPLTIAGVVADSRWRSVRDTVQPTVYRHDEGWLTYLEVRFASSDPAATKAAVEQVWKRIAPQVPFRAEFAEDRAADLYVAEAARAATFAAFAVLAVVVGCLGLFGLASFTAERRTKEIGIRKVLGARTADIVRLLVWQFSRPVLIANVIAWPVAWWVMRDWLNGFDARIALTPLPFVAAGGLALAIAVATIATHAIRVARANPIHALRYE